MADVGAGIFYAVQDVGNDAALLAAELHDSPDVAGAFVDTPLVTSWGNDSVRESETTKAYGVYSARPKFRNGRSTGKFSPTRRRPVWANEGYVKCLAYYLEYGHARGGSSVPESELIELYSLAESLSRLETHSAEMGQCANCGVDWWGSEESAWPIGCGLERFCTLCGPAAAAKLARGAVELFFDEAQVAALTQLKKNAQCAGGMATLPYHKILSKHLDHLLVSDPKRWQKEVNRMRRESWQVGTNAFGVGELAGNASVQLYGETSPGENHYHNHNVIAGVAVQGQVRSTVRPETKRCEVHDSDWTGDSWGRRCHQWGGYRCFSNGEMVMVHGRYGGMGSMGKAPKVKNQRRVGVDFTVVPLPKYLSDEQKLQARLQWGHAQVLCMKRLGFDPAEIGAEKMSVEHPSKGERKNSWVLQGVFHWTYFGWTGKASPEKWNIAVARGKGVLAYTQRWEGADYASGINADGCTYTWTKREGKKLVKHDRVLTADEITQFFWRIEHTPKRWPRVAWMGWMSTGVIGAWMEAFEWKKEKIEPEESDKSKGGPLTPVGWTSAGLRFRDSHGDVFTVRWDGIGSSPVSDEGKGLYKGRTHQWVHKSNSKGMI